MSYLVLARKFRPQNFDEVIGQEHISKTFKNAISEKRVAHAYLFSGPRGCGKTTVARILAKALNCRNGPIEKPCGICENCVEISRSSSIDVLEIDGASNNGIDEMRALRENVKFASANSNYKIYIIDEAHQITAQAFNALLKTLEEPPAHVVFIMATTERHKIPITIISRCQHYEFKLIPAVEMSKALKNIAREEGFKIDGDALNVMISASGGSMRDALSLLDQAVSLTADKKITGGDIRGLLGVLPKEIMVSVADNIAKGDIKAILGIVKEISEQGYNILQFARDLRDHLRRIMIYSVNPEIVETSLEDRKVLDVQKTLFTVSRHVRMNNLLSKALEEMRWYDQPRIILEMYLLKMSEPYYNIGELINKIAAFEKSVKSDAVRPEACHSSQKNRTPITDKVLGDANLLDAWEEIISDIIEKHPLTAQPLKKASVKIVDASSVRVTASGRLAYDSVLDFKERILKLLQKKTGLNAAMEVVFEKNSENKTGEKDDDAETVSEKENPSDNKNLKEAAIPKRIEEIAKKFESVAKKV